MRDPDKLLFFRKHRQCNLGDNTNWPVFPSFSLYQATVFLAVSCCCFSSLWCNNQCGSCKGFLLVEAFSVVFHDRGCNPPAKSVGISTKNSNVACSTRQTQNRRTARIAHSFVSSEDITTNLTNGSFERKGINDTTNDRNYTKSHSLTVCLVPPCETRTSVSNTTWDVLTSLRVQLRDPGLYRWPPHVNLLYPFVREVNNNNNVHDNSSDHANDNTISSSILQKLSSAARRIEPFWVLLDLSKNTSATARGGFGTFGGSTRGVLWVYPESFQQKHPKSNASKEPIVELQSLLEQEFPMCAESLKRRSFLPHLTLSSKFDSVDEARVAEKNLPELSQSKLWFYCQEFYLLERDGENGQFQRRVTIRLGKNNEPNSDINLHDSPLGFPDMPETEEAWVTAELEALKARRKANRTNRPRGTSRTRLSYRARKRAKKKAEARQAAASTGMDKESEL